MSRDSYKLIHGLLAILMLFSLAGFAQPKGFVINGTLSGVSDKSWVQLINANDPTDTLSKAMVQAGKFILKGKLDEPGLYFLNFPAAAKKGLLFLDNSTVHISGNAADIQNIKVEGSASQKDFREFQDVFNPLFTRYGTLGRLINQTGMSDSLQTETEKAAREIEESIDQFIKGKNQSFVAPFLLLVSSQVSTDTKQLESRFLSLSEPVRKGYYGKLVNEMIENSKIGEIGSAAIDFTQNDTTGKPVSLSSFKGKYVLVDFWASWCGPCRQENPNIVRTYEAFRNKNFTVLGVSLDRSREAWIKAIQDDQLSWTHVSDLKFWSNEAARIYRIESIPQNLLVNPEGKIIARNLRGPELALRLEELLK